MSNQEEEQSPPYVALKFTSNSDAQYMLTLYRRRRPSRYLAMPNPVTVVINRDDLDWIKSEIADREYKLHRVRTFADIDPDEAAKRRDRGLDC